jgi:hypothetical protein
MSNDKHDMEHNGATEHSVSEKSEIDLYSFHEQAAGRLVIDPECARRHSRRMQILTPD